MRLIDADALIEKIRSLWKTESSTEHKSVTWKCAVADAIILVLSVIAWMKPIDAEPVRHGQWIRMDDTFIRWRCSECGAIEPHNGHPYCHCGAKMDAKETST